MTPIGGQTGQANDRACSVVSLLMFGSDVVLRVVGRGVGDPVHQQYNTTRYLWHMQSTRIGTCIGACIVALEAFVRITCIPKRANRDELALEMLACRPGEPSEPYVRRLFPYP